MTLEIRNVSFAVGGLRILHDVALSVPADGLTGLIGPNGAGKSTLFSVVSGFLRATSGQVEWKGRALGRTGPAERARSGMVRTFQVPREFRHLTVRENLYAAAPDHPGEHLVNLLLRPRLVRKREREVHERADSLLAFLKLSDVADQPAGQLSGGQRKLLELGRVLMLEPQLVLLDEPFAGVNAVLISQIVERIRELQARGIGFLVIEHDLDALSALAQRMHVLDRGVLLASGTPQEVLNDARVRDAYLGGSTQ